MAQDDYLYIAIRVPKCGSTSLQQVLENALPTARCFDMVGQIYGDPEVSTRERFRAFVKVNRRLLKDYHCFGAKASWAKIDRLACSGDMVAGHFSISEVVIHRHATRFVTVLRNPITRLLSDYNYNRNGYNKRNILQQSILNGRIAAAGRYNFEGYLSFLLDHQQSYGRYMSHYVLGDQPVADKLAFMQNHYFAFGTLEKIDRFCTDFEQKSGAQTASVAKNVTPNKAKLSLSQRELALAERLCEEDLALYEIVDRCID